MNAVCKQVSFGHLTIGFDTRLLRPREWTTAQSRWGVELLRDGPPGPVLELCAGAGQIGLLAVALEPRPLVCVDVNPASAEHIRANAAAAGLAEDVEIRVERVDRALADDERYALVIADPPWVPHAELARFPEDPVLAIDGGVDGLDLARACTHVAARHLVPEGAALLQLGTDEQAAALVDDLPPELVCVEVRRYERGVVVRLGLRTSASGA